MLLEAEAGSLWTNGVDCHEPMFIPTLFEEKSSGTLIFCLSDYLKPFWIAKGSDECFYKDPWETWLVNTLELYSPYAPLC